MIKKTLITALSLLSTITLFFACASKPPAIQMSDSQLDYAYTKLKLLDLDQMLEIIQDKLGKYKSSNDVQYLVEAVTICLSRPDGDGMIEKIIDTIRYSAESNVAWERAVDAATQRAISVLRVDTTASVDQVTYLIFLDNLISEMGPEFIKQYQGPKFEKKIITKIAEANIVVSNSASSESRLNLMIKLRSPSSRAQSLINERNLKYKSDGTNGAGSL